MYSAADAGEKRERGAKRGKTCKPVSSAGKHGAGTKLDFLKVFSKSVFVAVDFVARLATSSLTLLVHKKATCGKSSTKRAREH